MLRHVDDDKDPKEEKLESQEYYEKALKNVPWHHRILLNRPLKVGLVMVALAIVVPVVIFYFYYQEYYFKMTVSDGFSIGTCSHNVSHRMPCGPKTISMVECDKLCCYDVEKSFCYHRMPSRYSYIRERDVWHVDTTPRNTIYRTKRNISNVEMSPRQATEPHSGARNLKRLQLFVNDLNRNHMQFILYDKTLMTYPDAGNWIEDKDFEYFVFSQEFFFEVTSTNSNITRPLLTTARGPLIAAKNLWEWSFYVGDDDIYGLGDVILESTTPELFYNNEKKTSSTPYFMSHRNGSYHGVYLKHRGPMEFTMFPNKVINVKSFAGDSLDVHFFYGENPKAVLQEFTSYTRTTKNNIPYWTLGAHFCRSNSTRRAVTNGIRDATEFLKNANDHNLPFESDCIIDELYQFINMEMEDVEKNEILAAIKVLTDESKRFMPSIRPHVRVDNTSNVYMSAKEPPILMLDAVELEEYEGVLYNDSVVYPDYGAKAALDWLRNAFNFESNSFILKDNWPKNLVRTNDCWVKLPYVTEDMNITFCETLPWNTRRPEDKTSHHYDHNSYGSNFAEAVKQIATELFAETPFILSSSNNIDSDVGYHMQNIYTSWQSMKTTYRRAVADSMSGIQIQSVPVCGDSEEFTAVDVEKLCIKWYSAAVYLPMFYVESNSIERHPFGFSGFAESTMVHAVQTRYKLLPYFYTVMNKNEPLIRAMYFDFYEDDDTKSIDEQYMVGDAIMIVPIFNDIPTTINTYFPLNVTWFSLWGGTVVPESESGSIEIPTTETEIPAFLRSGYIIPIQETIHLTAMEMRINSSYSLIIGLECEDKETKTNCKSEGSLFIAEDSYITFSSSETQLSVNMRSLPEHLCDDSTRISSNIINKISVYGLANCQNNYGNYHLENNINLNVCDGDIIHNYNLKVC